MAESAEIRVDDVEWLLSQVGTGEREYRVELAHVEYGLSPDDPSARWFPATSSTYRSREACEIYIAGVAEDDRQYYRVASAPVQVWTVEEVQ